MTNQLSILTISQNNENLVNLLNSIESSNRDDLEIDFLCSWNGKSKPSINSVNYNFDVKIFEETPYHFSKNNNLLASKSQAKYILFLNDDVLLDEDCLSNAYEQIMLPNIGIVGVNLRYENNNVQHAGVFFDKENLPYHRYKNQIHYTDPRISNNLVVPAITGAFLMIQRDEFSQVQFDERCEVAAQDIILCVEYKNFFDKDILYVANATAIHYENVTRRLYDQRLTPENDLDLLKKVNVCYKSPKFINRNQQIRLRIITEKPGWIMHRMAEEIAKRLPNTVINDDYPEANIHYYINYGYFNKKPANGIVVANFTHYDPNKLNDKWESVAHSVDHCVAISNHTKSSVKQFNITDEKITVIPTGADSSFKPKLTIGLVGRIYDGGRKGENLVKSILADSELMDNMQIVSTSDTWGVPTWNFDSMADFYRSVDYLLVPALYEGGPVPFMEALACGTTSIAPAIGVIPDFPHIEYKWNDIESLKSIIDNLKSEFIERKQRVSHTIEQYNWDYWSLKHITLFHKLLETNK